MKNIILIFCSLIGIASLTAFKYLSDHQNLPKSKMEIEVSNFNSAVETNFYYAVDSRFLKTVTKTQVQNALTIYDLFSVTDLHDLVMFQYVSLEINPRDANKLEQGESRQFNTAQRKLLKTADYKTDFCIRAKCKKRMLNSDQMEDYGFVYYIAIVPEQQAVYKNGHKSLLDYLKENSKDEAASVEQNRLKPGKVRFVISKKGQIKNVA